MIIMIIMIIMITMSMIKTVNEDEDKMQVLLVESPSHRGYREPPLGDRLTLLRFIIIIPTFTMTTMRMKVIICAQAGRGLGL